MNTISIFTNKGEVTEPDESKNYSGHHGIFDEFPRYSGLVKADFVVNYLGGVIHKDFLVMNCHATDQIIQADLPKFDEEYFEWVDILESILQAKDSYTFVELGAGFGRWAAVGLLAARLKGIKTLHAILVEAEPKHVEWAHRHMVDNAILPSQYKVYEAAVGGKKDKVLFMVEPPPSFGVKGPQEWYGQAVSSGYTEDPSAKDFQTYMGKPVLTYSTGWGAIEVDMIPIGDVLKDVNVVDMLDMDIQGAEADVIENGLDVLNKKVKRMHIGTHSHEVEARIQKALSTHGWIKLLDYPCNTISQTPFGTISFQDGVQSWMNPRYSNIGETMATGSIKLF